MENRRFFTGCLLTVALCSSMAESRAQLIFPIDKDMPSFWYGTVTEGAGRLTAASPSSDGLAAQGISEPASQKRYHSNVGIVLGYQMTPSLGFEAGYQELGKFSYSFAGGGGYWQSYGARFDVVGTWPLVHDFSAYARGGVYVSKSELSGGAGVTSESRTGANLTGGVGVSYRFTPRIDGTVGWDRYQSLGDNATGKTSIDNFGVGLKYKF